MPTSGEGTHSATRLVLRPSTWQLWKLPRATVGWLLCTEFLAAVAALAMSITGDWPTAHAWTLFAALVCCASMHLISTRPAEERRRAADLRVEHIDQTSIWLFAGALVLSMPLLVALVAIVRVQRYLIARKPPCRFVFTSAAIMLSAGSAHLIALLSPVQAWLAATPPAPWHAVSLALVGGGLLTAMAAYFAVQTVIIGVARGLSTRCWTGSALAGSRADNGLLMQAMCLGLLATLAVSFTVALLVVVVPVAVHLTRSLHRIQQLELDRQQLRSAAEHDPLTGLLNRRGFDPRARLALSSAAASGRPCAVVMFDVDHFTRWNSLLGHLGADILLKAVTDSITASVRVGDLLGRWGGEELALVLPDTDRAHAVAIVDRIRSQVASLRVPITTPVGGRAVLTNSDELPGCTISAGIAMAPEHGLSLHALQEIADQAVYQAKQRGRNRVETAPAPLAIPRQRVDSAPTRHAG